MFIVFSGVSVYCSITLSLEVPIKRRYCRTSNVELPCSPSLHDIIRALSSTVENRRSHVSTVGQRVKLLCQPTLLSPQRNELVTVEICGKMFGRDRQPGG